MTKEQVISAICKMTPGRAVEEHNAAAVASEDAPYLYFYPMEHYNGVVADMIFQCVIDRDIAKECRRYFNSDNPPEYFTLTPRGWVVPAYAKDVRHMIIEWIESGEIHPEFYFRETDE